MNCPDTETLILSERDGGLTPDQLTVLSDHLKVCPACRQLHDRLATAMDEYRTGIAQGVAPAADESWQALQERMNKRQKKRPLAPVLWFGAPLAAAAAVAIAFISLQPTAQPPPPLATTQAAVAKAPTEVARAEYVEAGDVNASTMVYVDKESGWLVVWATNVETKTSG
jgi:anti-sigma factor RsiW